MKLEWYSFDYSFLLSIDYRPTECRLILGIDARMSIDHPRVHQVTAFEEHFEEIEIVFDGVQYFRAINSKNLKHDPNDDIGSIERMDFISINPSKETSVRKQEGQCILSLDFLDGSVTEIFSKSAEIRYVNFVSSMLAFQLGFENFEIKQRT